jgi:DNA-binding response OmpR family regulator
MARKVLIIEDNLDIARLLSLHLKDIDCEPVVASDGVSGLKKAKSGRFDLIILDLMLPGLEGLELCRQLRSEPRYTPILMLTAKSSELDRVLGLEVGADDYLTKPFSILELLARVKAIFRRIEAFEKNGREQPRCIRAGEMTIDTEKRAVTIRGEPVELTAKEFDLLVQFACHPGRVYTRAQLLDLVWGYRHAGYEHTVNSHINRLRGKIEPNLSEPTYILTVWGVGYKFNDHLQA